MTTNEFQINVTTLESIEELKKESNVQKRSNADLRLKELFAGTLDKEYLTINWALAKTKDYDYIPWAEGLDYLQLWKKRNLKDFMDGQQALLYEVALDKNHDYFLQLDLILDFYRKEFLEKNILSLMLHTSESYPHCHILVYSDGQHHSDSISIRLKNFLMKHQINFKPVDNTPKNKNIPILNSADYYLPKNGYKYDEDGVELIYDAKSLKAISSPQMDLEQQEDILDKLLDYFTNIEKRMIKDVRIKRITKENFFRQVIQFLDKNYNLNQAEINVMLTRMAEAIFGYYVLDELIDDPSISDIKIISPDKIRIKRFGKRLTSNLHFRNLHDYLRFCDGLAIRNHTDLSEFNAVQNFTDTTTNKNCILRFNICTDYVNSVPYPYIHIRKISRIKNSLEDLMEKGMLDLKTAAYLIEKVKNASGILFAGKGGSGKTTLMNTLLEYIPYSKSGLVIQENEELFSYNHPDLMFQHTLIARQAGNIEYGLEELARNGLLTDLDYFIIGEIKGKEAYPFLNAAYTGHQCWATVHGASSTQAMDKLGDYVKYASDYSREDALRMLMALNIIIYMKNYKIYEISEIDGWDYNLGTIHYKTIYRYEKEN